MVSALHIYDCAGVAASLTTGMCKDDYSVGISVQLASHDIFRFSDVYKTQILFEANILDTMIIKVAKSQKGIDIVHLHFFWQKLELVKELFPDSKIVMHYHGSDVRGSDPNVRMSFEKYADGIVYSTPDLYDYKYDIEPFYLPTPIDTDMFNPYPIKSPTLKSFTILRSQHNREKFEDKLKDRWYNDVHIINREKEFRPYAEMPKFYRQFDTYIQLIYDNIAKDWIDSLSKTALECLASGLNVINPFGTLITEFPQEHDLKNVTNRLIKYYESL